MKAWIALLAIALTSAAAVPALAQPDWRDRDGRWQTPDSRWRYQQPPPPTFTPPQSGWNTPGPAMAGDRRTEWDYGGGRFRMVGPGQWVEETVNGVFRYDETDRNPEYIEMHDPDRGAMVRLYQNQMVSMSDGGYAWNRGYTGHWR